MIDLYTWTTPNGYKVSIALEELGLRYDVKPVAIGRGDQFKPEFLKISPNNKIPAIVDHEGPDGKPISVFESGAILIYLADKTKKLMPLDARGRYATLEWLMFQMASVGPMFGQAGHFRVYAPEKIPYAIDRYTNEAKRLYGVIDRRLGESQYIAGPEYTIADIALFPWVRGIDRFGFDTKELPNFTRWMKAIDERPAVKRGLAVPPPPETAPVIDDKAREVLFGKQQYERR